MRARASCRCEQLELGYNGIGAAGAAVLADALIANRTLRALVLADNSIGDEGAAALARALATNRSLARVCLAKGGPQWVGSEWWGWPLLCTHTRASLPCHSSVVVVAQLGLNDNSIDDAGISAMVGALAANDTLKWVCDGRHSGAGCTFMCVCHARIGFVQLGLGKSYGSLHRCNVLSDAGARALVLLLGAARARPELHVCPRHGASWRHAHNNALLTPCAVHAALAARPRRERCHKGRPRAMCSRRDYP